MSNDNHIQTKSIQKKKKTNFSPNSQPYLKNH